MVSQAEVSDRTGAWVVASMTAHDLLEVVEIENACELSRWGWDSYHAELSNPQSIMLVARRKGDGAFDEREVCGFVAARVGADELHVNNIAVRNAERQRGVGGVLLAGVLLRGRELGARSATLEVRAGNHAAQALYSRHGFRVVGRRPNYYYEPAEDALLMSAVLQDRA